MTKTLSEIKAEAGRDLDSSLADSTLVPGEASNFGAFSFGALWNWIKGKCATVVASGNTNPVTSGAVKAELDANYQSKNYLINLTDANQATSNGISNSYRVSGNCLNIPVERIGILTVYGYVSGQYYRTTQEFITNDDNKNVVRYMREGFSNNNGTSWTWGTWQRLVTEGDLANYQKIQERPIIAGNAHSFDFDASSYPANSFIILSIIYIPQIKHYYYIKK